MTDRPPLPVDEPARGPRGFAWLLEGQLAGAPRPGFVLDVESDLEALRRAGILWLIALTDVALDAAQASKRGIRWVSSPVRDRGAPTLVQARELCMEIDMHLAAGEAVAVHCQAGLGRTATVLAAYWIWMGKGAVDASEALDHVRSVQPAMVQSPEQVDFLRRWAEDVRISRCVADPHSDDDPCSH